VSNADLCAIAVMAKAPRAGAVKTRLCPPLSPEEARSMSAAFLRDVTENIRQAAAQAPVRGFVAFAPAGTEALFDGCLAPGTGLVLADGAIEAPPNVAGFGLCLLHAVRSLLDLGFGAACVLNADSPTLPRAFLRELVSSLLRPGGDRAVMGPAEDGGYYVLGLKAAHAGMFADIAWSTDRVAEETRARSAELGLDLTELPPWFDVDGPVALRRLMDEADPPPWQPGGSSVPFAAPATMDVLAPLRLSGRIAVAG
jgi:glycosyltransferase A (GT-A) superfamily protein (DUF2064 family)